MIRLAPEEFFALLADETRLRCLLLLYKEAELCVCEFSHILSSIQPKISRHLAHLRKSGFVIDERRGQWIYYRLNPGLPAWMRQILTAAFQDLQHREPYRSDSEKITIYRRKNPCLEDRFLKDKLYTS